MNSHKEWSDAPVGKSSQNVEIKITLNIKDCEDNFKMLVSSLLLRSQRADESSWELFRSTFDVCHQIWYRNATTSIFRFLKIGNFQEYLENPLKMWNLKKFKTVQKLSRSNSETIYKLLVLRKTISSYPHIPWYSRLSWFQHSEINYEASDHSLWEFMV